MVYSVRKDLVAPMEALFSYQEKKLEKRGKRWAGEEDSLKRFSCRPENTSTLYYDKLCYLWFRIGVLTALFSFYYSTGTSLTLTILAPLCILLDMISLNAYRIQSSRLLAIMYFVQLAVILTLTTLFLVFVSSKVDKTQLCPLLTTTMIYTVTNMALNQ